MVKKPVLQPKAMTFDVPCVGGWSGPREILHQRFFEFKEVAEGSRVAKEDAALGAAARLGVPVDATHADVEVRLRRLAARHPPDLNQSLWLELRSAAEIFRHPIETLAVRSRCDVARSVLESTVQQATAEANVPEEAKRNRSVFLRWLDSSDASKE